MVKESGVVGPSKNSKKRAQPEVIEISSDEEDYKSRSADKHRSKIMKMPASSASTDASTKTPQAVSVMENKHERKKLEAERLARQSLREQQLAANSKTSSSNEKNSHQSSSSLPHSDVTPSLQNYWQSTIKTTFNSWYPDSPHSIRIEDLIGPKNRIKVALVSSYVAQLAWIHNLFDPKTRIMVIKHDAEPGTFKVNERDNMFLCHPPMLKSANGKTRTGYFSLLALEFTSIINHNANAVDFDYERVENSVWVQDFRRSSPVGASKAEERHANTTPPFKKAFQNLLKLMGVPTAFSKYMEDYDFSPAAGNLVVSIQGTHPPDSSYGQVGLANELKALGLDSGPSTGRTVTLECQGSSIGGYDMRWINNFYRCASGSTLTGTSSDSSNSSPSVSVLFPTLHTVKSSKAGPTGGGTIFCNKATWQKSNFPIHLFADAISKRLGVLMHVKMVLGVFTSDSGPDKQIAGPSNQRPSSTKRNDTENEVTKKDNIGFLYIGSHNFTPAAWGKLVEKNGANQMDISNWELGVVLPLGCNSQLEQYVPWQRPPKRYGHNGADSKIPWMQFSHHH